MRGWVWVHVRACGRLCLCCTCTRSSAGTQGIGLLVVLIAASWPVGTGRPTGHSTSGSVGFHECSEVRACLAPPLHLRKVLVPGESAPRNNMLSLSRLVRVAVARCMAVPHARTRTDAGTAWRGPRSAMVCSDDRTPRGTHLDMSMSSALPFIFPDIASSSTDPATVPSCNHHGLQPRDRLYLNPDAMYARCPPVGLRRLRRH